ncbi:TonB family protein [Cellvibrio sp. QJXJ]|uniref:TonB family protein n=1 Tax=Cellvibrio sp. QJXJ TaxID=2964606 RepID=UPI0021C37290|nr:TonB family protein [Cellvibrio sp. QJXJ]UUA72336.1 TonB family protein [Cellvibrio sp. QJXJ]
MLNGVGVHQELGREVFIGALFSESLSNDAGTLLRNSQPMRMELKIVAPEGITARRFSRLWIEGLAVNSKADELMAQADNTVLFDNMFKGRLQKDDHVVIASAPGAGISVNLNNIELGKIEDESFFYMLLATWIGNVPLSSDYRDSLLKVGDVDAGLRGRFAAIAPAANRAAEINAWNNKLPAVEPIAAAQAPAEVPKLDAPAIDKPKLDIPLPVAQKSSVSKSSAAPIIAQVASSAPAAAAPVSTPVAEEEEDEGPALTAQTLLARQFYVSDSIKKIRTKTKYPQRALDRNQAGNVRVAVVVDRDGNLISSSIIESSQYDLLNREALEAIKRSAPFPALPEAISGTRFEFSVPMRWALP